MSKTETIEEKMYRLMGWLYGAQPPFKTVKQTNDFKLRCQMLELAIAEERDACAKICDEKHWDWSFGSQEEESSTSGPKECAELIRQRSATKSEVS